MSRRLASALLALTSGCATTTVDLAALTALPEPSQPTPLPGGGVAFVSDATGDVELWLAALGGEARAVTHLGVSVDSPTAAAVSGVPLVFAADGGGDERYDLWSVQPDGAGLRQLTHTPEVSESSPRLSPDGRTLVALADPSAPFQPQLHRVDRATGALSALTSGDVPVWEPVWAPDSAAVAVTRSADWSDGELVVVTLRPDAEGAAETRTVAPPPGGHALWPHAFSPNAREVLCTTTSPDGFEQLALVTRDSGEVRRIGPGDWDVEDALWDAEGIVFTRNVAGRSGLYRLTHADASVEELLAPRGVIGSLARRPDGGALLFDRTDAATPPALWQLTGCGPVGAKPCPDARPLTPTGAVALAPVTPFALKARDGVPLTGFVLRPREGRAPYPAVVFVHGGPDGQSRDRFDAQRQALALSGFVVVDVNFRGSTGFGRAFAELDTGDWGGGDRLDLRDAVEHFAAEGLIDRARVGIMGGSFGGYMTLLALALDSDLYRAGVDLYGMPDLTLDYEMTKDRYEAWYRAEMGSPEERPELFRDRSPMTHLAQLKAPLLVFHGENDSDVPKAQSDALVAALRAANHPVEYVVYPGEGHVFSKPRNRLDVLERAARFFREHL